MKLQKEDYKKAEGCLRRYNYNCITIIDMNENILGINATTIDGMPKAKYNISDSVYNKYIQLQENEELNEALKEIKAVRKAIALVNKDEKDIFENYYLKQKTKWETIEILGLSERTFLRRKKDLIYTVERELKKLA